MFKWVLAAGALLLSDVVIAQGQVATYPSEKGKVSVTVIKKGLDHPWGLAFLPDQKGMLVTERPGRLRVLKSDGSVSNPIAGLPVVYNRSQGGLMDVALSPSFAEDRLIYLSYSEGGGEDDKAGTAVGRGTFSADMTRVEGFTVIFRQEPKLSTGAHFGSRLVFDQQGYLFIALGENNQRITAQALDKLQGKLVRIKADGTVPNDNPFVGQSGARPEIWSYGHRNQQGAALNPWTEQVWTNEHGPRGGDEVNIPLAGKNYGWPVATHGINYSYTPIPEAKGKDVPGTEQPLYVWEKSPGVSGMAFYSADRFPAWKNSLFIGALAQESLIRLQLEGNKVVHEERLLEEKGARIRDVRQGPDGYLYVLTDSSEGEVLKIGLE
ncbi:PQQ-dependent sugar dehydrogenase [Pseudomonas luteola]|uniref:PQQ-dependent sugar dehydrogenase n=1 Tax=Pseudomonas luteola TaxID=47886 RepID=UPI0012397C90|nr:MULTISPECIES: PQQ-dependent sugar dehydrogenase [Pseudomonas]MBA1247776.1 PQQ-dependent sugar dehydrogenase [Pseudomonas zeshuii]QEU29292.1 PQQ-dependent sugar dehydrogenase [Pseudomonas luteola]